MSSPLTVNETNYDFDLIDNEGRVVRNPSKHQTLFTKRANYIWSVIESRSVHDLDGKPVWFEQEIGRYHGNDVSPRTVRSLVKYLNEANPLRDYLYEQRHEHGGVSLFHQRIIMSPDAMQWPRTGFPLVKKETVAHIVHAAPVDYTALQKNYSDIIAEINKINNARFDEVQNNYYSYLLNRTDSKEEFELIQRRIDQLQRPQGPLIKRHSVIKNKSARAKRAISSISR